MVFPSQEAMYESLLEDFYRYRYYLSDSPSHLLLNKMEGKDRKGKFLSRSQLLQFSYLPLSSTRKLKL